MNVPIIGSRSMELSDLDFLFLNYLGKKDDTGIVDHSNVFSPCSPFSSQLSLSSFTAMLRLKNSKKQYKNSPPERLTSFASG